MKARLILQRPNLPGLYSAEVELPDSISTTLELRCYGDDESEIIKSPIPITSFNVIGCEFIYPARRYRHDRI